MMLCDVAVVGAGPAGVAAAIKSAEAGYSTIMLEEGGRHSAKPCGGVLTAACVDVLSHELGLSLPEWVLSTPASLGLFYVSPSGYGGRVKNYKLVNIDRSAFNEWLRSEAEDRGVKAMYNTRLVGLERCGKEVLVKVKRGGKVETLAAGFLVGADGALSKTRTALHPGANFKLARVVQEHWDGDCHLEDCFYTLLLKASVTPLYGYLIPKGSTFIVGAGAPTIKEAEASVSRVREVLEGMGFKPRRLLRREHWFIPHGTVLYGSGNVILVGDAGGFCNPFSGEGIRFALETGGAVRRALEYEDNFSEVYRREVEELAYFIRTLSDFTANLDDDAREKFVKHELRRIL